LEYDPSTGLGKMTQTLRADLHVHSRASKVNGNVPFLKSRDCYSAPQDVYRVAKARGMDLVAMTDHDSIDGALELLDRGPGAVPGAPPPCLSDAQSSSPRGGDLVDIDPAW